MLLTIKLPNVYYLSDMVLQICLYCLNIEVPTILRSKYYSSYFRIHKWLEKSRESWKSQRITPKPCNLWYFSSWISKLLRTSNSFFLSFWIIIFLSVPKLYLMNSLFPWSHRYIVKRTSLKFHLKYFNKKFRISDLMRLLVVMSTLGTLGQGWFTSFMKYIWSQNHNMPVVSSIRNPYPAAILLCTELHDKRLTNNKIGKLSFVINIINHIGPKGRKK